MSFFDIEIEERISSLNLTYLPTLLWMELAPYPETGSGQVVKASSGHFPPPFWISLMKELLQR